MSLEVINVVAGVGTFVVIAASAIAALVQLRHMRSSTQIVALTEFRETMESKEFREAQQFVSFELPQRLLDPAERKKMMQMPLTGDYEKIRTLANLFESLGTFVKLGIIDQEIACDIWGFVILRNWNIVVPLVTYTRSAVGEPSVWENFEYLAALSKRHNDAHPNGTYPPGVERMPEDRSLLDATSGAERSGSRVGST